jgi:hypothetical protein
MWIRDTGCYTNSGVARRPHHVPPRRAARSWKAVTALRRGSLARPLASKLLSVVARLPLCWSGVATRWGGRGSSRSTVSSALLQLGQFRRLQAWAEGHSQGSNSRHHDFVSRGGQQVWFCVNWVTRFPNLKLPEPESAGTQYFRSDFGFESWKPKVANTRTTRSEVLGKPEFLDWPKKIKGDNKKMERVL